MRMPRYFGTALIMLALISSLQADGQPASEGDLRDPNPQERQILMHYREVIGKVLDQFQSDDWEEKVDYEITDDVSVSGDPDVPLDVNEMIQRSYTIRPGSALYQKEVAPLAKKSTATTDPNEMARLAKQRKVTNLVTEVHFNHLCVGLDQPGDRLGSAHSRNRHGLPHEARQVGKRGSSCAHVWQLENRDVECRKWLRTLQVQARRTSTGHRERRDPDRRITGANRAAAQVGEMG